MQVIQGRAYLPTARTRRPRAPSLPKQVDHGKVDQREFGKDLTERPRATAQAALQPERYRPLALGDAGVDRISGAAQRNGTASAIAAAAASGAAVLGLNALSARFRAALGLSGKLALVVTPTFGAFILNSHLTLADAHADPDGFVAPHQQQRASAAVAPERESGPPVNSLGVRYTLANFVFESPFKTILGIALPLYGSIFYRESVTPQTASMLLSQRLIHTRVYGQAVAVLTTVYGLV